MASKAFKARCTESTLAWFCLGHTNRIYLRCVARANFRLTDKAYFLADTSCNTDRFINAKSVNENPPNTLKLLGDAIDSISDYTLYCTLPERIGVEFTGY